MSPEGDGDGGSGDAREAGNIDVTRVHGAQGDGPGSGQGTPSRVGRGRGGAERRMVPKDRPRSYYEQPIVKPPVWTWEIPWYFFAGGMAGASAPLAWAAGTMGNETLARRAWAAAMAGVVVSPALLISDLGRPERFLNMLRVFKVTSPMSVGSWILSVNGALIAPAALGAFWKRGPRVLRAAGPLAAIAGPGLSTYTAVLIANSAIPVWSEARRQLPFLFAAGSAASAGGVATILTPAAAAGPARRLAIAGGAAELAVAQAMERSLGTAGEPYHGGTAGRLSKAAQAMTAAGTAMLALGRRRRGIARAGAGLLVAGAACERWAIYKAGFASAGDPAYTVGPQRDRLERSPDGGAAGQPSGSTGKPASRQA